MTYYESPCGSSDLKKMTHNTPLGKRGDSHTGRMHVRLRQRVGPLDVEVPSTKFKTKRAGVDSAARLYYHGEIHDL